MPPDGVILIAPSFPAHVALVTAKLAFTPALICISGSVPHLGAIRAEFRGQTLFGAASVHAKNKLVSFIDSPHRYVIVPKFTEFIEFLIIGPLQPVLEVEDFSVPLELYISKVPQKAKDVLVESVLLLIENVNVRVTVVPGVHVLHASPPVRVAATNSKSFDVHELAEGKVCATAVPDKSIVKNKITLVNDLILKA